VNITHNIKSISVEGQESEDLGGSPVQSRQTWDEMVFENRNKEYGAYVLRQGYSRGIAVGLFIVFALMTLALSYSRIAKLFGGDEVSVNPVPKKLVYTELSAPPPIDKPKPPPPQIQLPKLQKVIKFVPPKVVKEQVVEEVPTIQEIKETETAAVEVDGSTDVVFEEPVQEVVVADPNEIFTVVEQNPEYPGGYDAMMNFVRANMVYPPAARRLGIEGTVYVSFIVHKTGVIDEVKILRGVSAECDKEAIRVISKMPNWIPGKQNGHLVNVRFTLPLKFRLN
jgi:periplasmic protein TonB